MTDILNPPALITTQHGLRRWSFPLDVSRSTLSRAALLLTAGAAPVSAIAVHVIGWMPMRESAPFVVAPLALIAVVLIAKRSLEAQWALRGAVAGLIAVMAYDAVRMPLVWLNIWPDFIPRMGGWVTGGHGTNALIGYAWRYVGDGAGIGLAYFAFCAVVLQIGPNLVRAHPIMLSVAYGIFVWSGLVATVAIPPDGQALLFKLTAASFGLSLLGHLIYGSVLGICLNRYLVRDSSPAV
ncbi:MAG: hypothetical protein ACTHJM_14795 [Marmoricola sp.]